MPFRCSLFLFVSCSATIIVPCVAPFSDINTDEQIANILNGCKILNKQLRNNVTPSGFGFRTIIFL